MSLETDYELARANPKTHSIWCVVLTLPAYEDLPELPLRFADVPHIQDGNRYTESLVTIPNFNQSSGSAADGGSFVIDNSDGEIWNQIYPYRKLLNEATVTIYELLNHVVYEVPTDLYLQEIVVPSGYITNRDLPNENQITITYESDFSRKGWLIGARILTSRYCVFRFNTNGLLSPEIDPCGWQVEQGGNPTFCSLLAEGVDGCDSHNNLHRIGVVRGLVDVTVINTDDTLGGGFGYDINPTHGIHPPLLN